MLLSLRWDAPPRMFTSMLMSILSVVYQEITSFEPRIGRWYLTLVDRTVSYHH